ncbi:hypothetical protein HDU67_006222 [Dinochytrium kinnereticum]|nr:hypothetical protein HDU67_006222 [Dinochytrium kinnereticum]
MAICPSLITHSSSVFPKAISFISRFSMLPFTFLLALIASASAVSIPSDNFNDVVAFASDPDIGGLPQIDERSGEWPTPETGRHGESWSEAASNLDGIDDFASPDISGAELRLTPDEQEVQDSERKEVKELEEARSFWSSILRWGFERKINRERSKFGNSPLSIDRSLTRLSSRRVKSLVRNSCQFVSDSNLGPGLSQNYHRVSSSGPLNQEALINKWSKAKLKSIRDNSQKRIGCATETGKNCRLTICTMST